MKDDPRIERMAVAAFCAFDRLLRKPDATYDPVVEWAKETNEAKNLMRSGMRAALSEALKPIPMDQMPEEYRDGRQVLIVFDCKTHSRTHRNYYLAKWNASRFMWFFYDADRDYDGLLDMDIVGFLPLYTEGGE